MKTGIDLYTARARNRLLRQFALAALIVLGTPFALYFIGEALSNRVRIRIEPTQVFHGYNLEWITPPHP